jgi:plastocyanin
MRSLCCALVTALFAISLRAATVEVRVTDAGGAAVPDAVAYAVPDVPIPVGHKVADMDQKNRAFVPRILPIQAGTWVEFPNSDDIRHEVYSLSPAKRFQLPLYSGKPSFPVQFPTVGVVALGCHIHQQMNAYIIVVDTPYFGRAEAGRVSLKDIRVGHYTIHVWYPGMREEPEPKVLTLADNDHPTLSFVATAK